MSWRRPAAWRESRPARAEVMTAQAPAGRPIPTGAGRSGGASRAASERHLRHRPQGHPLQCHAGGARRAAPGGHGGHGFRRRPSLQPVAARGVPAGPAADPLLPAQPGAATHEGRRACQEWPSSRSRGARSCPPPRPGHGSVRGPLATGRHTAHASPPVPPVAPLAAAEALARSAGRSRSRPGRLADRAAHQPRGIGRRLRSWTLSTDGCLRPQARHRRPPAPPPETFATLHVVCWWTAPAQAVDNLQGCKPSTACPTGTMGIVHTARPPEIPAETTG